MVSTEVLELLLAARYVGRPAFNSFSNDIEGVVAQSNALTRVGAAFSALGDVAIAAGVAVGIGLAATIKQAAEYQQSLTRVQSVTNYTGPQMQQLSDTIMSVSDTYGQSSQQIADASYLILSHMGGLGAGFQDVMNAKILPALGAFVEASGAGKAGSVDWMTAANDTVHVLTGMHQPLKDWGADLGILTFLENNAGLTQTQMTSAFTRFMPTAGALGMNFGQSSDLIAAIASSGVFGAKEGTELATGLRMAFSGSHLTALESVIGDPSKFFKNGAFTDFSGFINDLAPKLMAIQDPIKRLQTATNIFGAVGGRTFLEFVQGKNAGGTGALDIFNTLEKKRNAVGDPLTYMLNIAFKQAQGPQAQFDILKAALQNLAIVVGTDLMPVVMHLVVWLTNAVIQLQNFTKAHPALTKALATAAVPALIGGGIGMKNIGGILQFIGQQQLQHASTAEKLASGNAAKLTKYDKALNDWKNQVAMGNQKTDDLLAKDVERKTAAYEQAHTKWLNDVAALDQQKQVGLGQAVSKWEQDFGRLGQSQRDTLNKLDAEARKDLDAFPKKVSKAAEETNKDFFGRTQATVAGLGIKPKSHETHAAFIQRANTALAQYHKDTYANYVAADKGARRSFEEDIARLGEKPTSQQFETLFGPRYAALGKEPRLNSFLTPFAGSLPTLPTRPVKEAEQEIDKGVLDHIKGIFGGIAKGGAGFGKGLLAKPGSFLFGKGGPAALDAFDEAGGFQGMLKTGGKKLASPFIKGLDFGAKGLEKFDAVGGFPGMLQKLATLIPTILPELGGLAAGFAAVLGVVLAVAGIIAIIVLAFVRYRKEAMHLGEVLGKGLQPVFKAFGAIIKTVTEQIQKAWEKAAPAIDKAMGTLFKVLPKLIPLFIGIGAVIGFFVSVILSVVSGLVNGFLSALPNIIGFFTSIISLVADVVKFVIDAFTNWKAIPGDIQAIGADIWGIVTNAFGAIGNFIWGFIQGVIGFFEYLWNVLTKHSIIPDMINDIVHWFLQLPGQLLDIISQLILAVITQMEAWAVQMVQAGINLVLGLAQGILGAAGAAIQAIGSVAQSIWQGITSFFGISSPSLLLATAGMNIDQGLALGINSNAGLATSAASSLATGVNAQFSSMATTATTTATTMSTQTAAIAANLSRLTLAPTKEQSANGYTPLTYRTSSYIESPAQVVSKGLPQEQVGAYTFYNDFNTSLDKIQKSVNDKTGRMTAQVIRQYQTMRVGSDAELDKMSAEMRVFATVTPAATARAFSQIPGRILPYQLQILQQVRKQMADVNTATTTGAATAANSAYQAGIGISQGIANGIMARKQAALLAAEDLASTVNTGFKGHLQIRSPSRVFFEHGVNTVLGYIQGVMAHYPDIQRTWSELGVPSSSGYSGTNSMNIDTLHVGNLTGLPQTQSPRPSTYDMARAIQYERLNQRSAIQPINQQALMNAFDLQYRYAYQKTQ